MVGLKILLANQYAVFVRVRAEREWRLLDNCFGIPMSANEVGWVSGDTGHVRCGQPPVRTRAAALTSLQDVGAHRGNRRLA